MKKYLLILLIAISCDQELSPRCQDLADACKDALRKRDQATTAKEKEQYYQFYLGYKHDLDHCR